MRIAVGQIWQETNTLNPCPTTREDFELFGVSRGAEMVSEMAHTNELGGFIQSLRQWADAPEIVGLARLPAWPGGLITADAYEWIADEMATAVDRAMPVDGVLLALHGAMAADGYPDVEGSILHRFRQRIGDHVPLVVTLDLHANITPRTFDICRRIAAAGVKVAEVAATVYQNSSIGKIRITGALLDQMQLCYDDRIAILRVDESLLKRTHCLPNDMEGVINMPLSAKSVQAVIMFRTETSGIRVSMRSKNNVDVRQIAVSYGGGGHRNAAGFSTDVAQPELESKLLTQIRKALDSSTDLNPSHTV